ncbi:hypothetical protein GGI25_002220 [Coemansia spiralis]|uniref:MPN domain-containing protein n=2 Tax=Coemansia TaxID=4863 RepID=A0A9W8G9H6_9FUNG|nr:hypothetical protein EDC05_000120 [Coemansia umbellata]KAJ2626014.1 hypothetical protein GGI26_000098 [Coemansia sp. RSA 1358]KAJ2678632.1 hypothetical protein GGI25_002220 [Coemansia spiralis]
MIEYTVSLQAYAKAILHCAKYPWATVHGLFLAEKKDGKIRFVDALPLAHNWTSLTPMFDVALQQAQLYAKTKGLAVCGYYVANEDTGATQLSAAGSLLAKTLIAVDDSTVAFVVDAKKLAPESTRAALVPYVYSESQWKEQSGAFSDTKGSSGTKGAAFVLENNRVLVATRKLIDERAEVGVHDFDEHVDDVSLDWLQNTTISERIKTA